MNFFLFSGPPDGSFEGWSSFWQQMNQHDKNYRPKPDKPRHKDKGRVHRDPDAVPVTMYVEYYLSMVEVLSFSALNELNFNPLQRGQN